MKILKFGVLAIGVFFISSSATKYLTPGGSGNKSELADEEISEILSNKPTAEIPVNIAIARIQPPQYTNWRYQRAMYNQPQGGHFSMVLTRDWEEECAFEKLSTLDGVNEASPFNRLLLSYNYKSNA